jgi:hypothetical protein
MSQSNDKNAVSNIESCQQSVSHLPHINYVAYGTGAMNAKLQDKNTKQTNTEQLETSVKKLTNLRFSGYVISAELAIKGAGVSGSSDLGKPTSQGRFKGLAHCILPSQAKPSSQLPQTWNYVVAQRGRGLSQKPEARSQKPKARSQKARGWRRRGEIVKTYLGYGQGDSE